MQVVDDNMTAGISAAVENLVFGNGEKREQTLIQSNSLEM